MATTSTIPTVKARIVTVLTTALATANQDGGQLLVSYAWPGPDADSGEMVFLGFHPRVRDIRIDASHDITTIKAGRKHRQENYDVPITVWIFRPDLSPDDAATCEARAFTVAGLIEDEFADDTDIGLALGTVQRIKVTDVEASLYPFLTGWACELVLTTNVRATLT